MLNIVKSPHLLLYVQVAMLVEVELEGDKIAAGLFAHKMCSESVGISVAAFARCVRGGAGNGGQVYRHEAVWGVDI